MTPNSTKTRSNKQLTRSARIARIVFTALALVAIGFFGYWLYQRIQRQMMFSRTAVADHRMRRMAEAQTEYMSATGRFMPWSPYPQGPRLDIDNWAMGNQRVASQFLDFDLGDPFNPDKTLLFWSDRAGWTIWSVGPDGDSDLPPDLYANPDPAARYATTPYQYDPTNGIASSGDIILIYRPALVEGEANADGAS